MGSGLRWFAESQGDSNLCYIVRNIVVQFLYTTIQVLIMVATARLDMRIDPQLREEVERAAALIGARSLSDFVTQALREKTRQVLQSHERLVLNNQVFDDFFTACMEDSEPSEGLLEAARITDELGIR